MNNAKDPEVPVNGSAIVARRSMVYVCVHVRTRARYARSISP